MEISISQISAVIATFIFACLAFFQLLLAIGKPYGEYAWGGQHKILPKSLRVGSVVSVGLYTLFSMIYIDKSSLITIFPEGIIKSYGIWVLVAYLVVGVVVNGISRSKKERNTMTPIIIVLLICGLIIGLN
jgi:hypothetical protein